MDFILDTLRVLGLIFLVVVVFNLMIVVHELGHFLAARWRGLKVEKFYVWFGKPLWKKKINGVEYGLGSIPVGGYVALPQMAPMEAIEGRAEEPREKLPPITPLDKIIVAFAGPLFSFGLAVLFAVLVWVAGKPVDQSNADPTTIGYVAKGKPADLAGLRPGDKVISIDGHEVKAFTGLVDSITWLIVSSKEDNINFLVERPGEKEPLNIPVLAAKPEPEVPASWWRGFFTRPAFRQAGIAPAYSPKVDSFIDGGTYNPAAKAGLQKGDVVESFNGEKVYSLAHLSQLTEGRLDQATEMVVLRGAEKVTLTLTPKIPDQKPDFWKLEDHAFYALGVKEWTADVERTMIHPSPVDQIRDSSRTIFQTLAAITSPKGDLSASHLSGFLGIGRVYYNLLQDPNAWQMVFWFSVVLNVNLAILNMLPFPVLDGGHITMALLEWIRKRPLNIRVLEVVQTACVLLLFGFMIFITFKDAGDLMGVGKKTEKPEKVELKYLAPTAAPANP